MTSSLGYMELCRLCLVKDKVTVPIFGDTNDVRQIFLKITACLPVKVSRDDNLPKKICDSCLYKIDLLYQFWNTTINAEKQLIQWLNEIGVDAKNVDASLQMLPQSHAHPHAMQEEIMMKEERIESETKDGGTGFPNLYTEFPYQNPENNFETPPVVEEATPAKRKTRGRPAGKKKAKVIIPESDDEDSIGSDRLANDDTNDSDSDGGKIAKQEADSDEDYVDNPESLEPTTFVDVPSAADAEQPGPSGLSKPATITAGTSDQGIPDPMRPTKKLTSCRDCGATFPSKRVLYNHTLTHMEATVPCEWCDKLFVTQGRANYHQRVVHIRDFKFECDICNRKFVYEKLLDAHKKRHYDQFQYPCDDCGKGYSTKSEFDEHVRVQHEGLRYICFPCNKSFKNHYYFGSHMRLHNPNLIPKVYKCKLCSATFDKIGCLNGHRRKHRNDTYVCDICGKTVSTPKSLRDHKMIHSGEKPFTCQTCGKNFINQNYLTTHIRSHTKEKPYACKECGKAFTQISTLRVHERLHSGERPYSCGICHKNFISKSAMKTHTKVHGTALSELAGMSSKSIDISL